MTVFGTGKERAAPGFRGDGIDRVIFIAAPTGVRHMVGAAANGTAVPAVDDVKHQR